MAFEDNQECSSSDSVANCKGKADDSAPHLYDEVLLQTFQNMESLSSTPRSALPINESSFNGPRTPPHSNIDLTLLITPNKQSYCHTLLYIQHVNRVFVDVFLTFSLLSNSY